MFIYGTGGHAKVLFSALPEANFLLSETGCFLGRRSQFLGRSIFTPDEVLPGNSVLIAIGDGVARQKVYESLSIYNFQFPYFIHPSALIEALPEEETIGRGSHILAKSFIGAGSKIGNFVIINTGATVDHDCEIGNFSHIAPGVNLCGGVIVGTNTLVGVGSCARPRVRIGSNCTIGAGSVIVSDIPDNSLAYGNPCIVQKRKD